MHQMGIEVIVVFRVPFRGLGDFWDPDMQAPVGPGLLSGNVPESLL